MGRRKLTDAERTVTHSLRLTPDLSNAVCRAALRRDVPVSRFLAQVVAHVFRYQNTPPAPSS